VTICSTGSPINSAPGLLMEIIDWLTLGKKDYENTI